jgi:hypothetical protein
MMLGHIQNILFGAIISQPDIPTPEKIAVVQAFGKLLWIQNDLFAKWFVKDGEEYGETNQRLQWEAAMKGGKADDFVEKSGERVGCPFSSVARTLKNQAQRPGYVYQVDFDRKGTSI